MKTYCEIWKKTCVILQLKGLPIFDLDKESDYRKQVLMSAYEAGLKDGNVENES